VRLLTLARDLRRRRARERLGLFVAEGVRAVEAALDAGAAARGALVGPALAATERGRALRARLDFTGVPVMDVDERDFVSAADTEAPQGVLLVAAQPAAPPALADHPALAGAARQAVPGRELRVLVLDAVQDPGNVGTLVRAAAGLGATAVVALPGTADVWSAKVVRAAMGAHFAVPTLPATPDALAAFLAAFDIPLWGADGDGADVGAAAPDAPPRLAVALGNEGAGLTPAVRALVARLVAVPSSGLVESYNVAVAGSILLYALRPTALRAAPPRRPDS
jgi:TrmH family RNA methyltransferase